MALPLNSNNGAGRIIVRKRRRFSWPMVRRASLLALLQMFVWTVLAVSIALFIRKVGSNLVWRELLLSGIAHYWACALIAPVLVFLTLRFAHRPWRQQAVFYLAGAAIFVVLHPAVTVLLIDWAPDVRPTYVEFIFGEFWSSIVEYAGITAFALVLSYYKEAQARKIEEASLRAELAQAHLQVLRTQIHPDFLFNTFREISRLMETDTEAARGVMARLSEMLRLSLDGSNSEHASLRESLELFECYLDLEKARLGSMFRFDFRAPEETLEAIVPRELLPSVVETVLDSAVAPLAQPAFVNIHAERVTDRLRMAVEIGGPGLAHSQQWAVNAEQTESKLQDLLDDEQSLRCSKLSDQSLRVEMEMPFAAAGAGW